MKRLPYLMCPIAIGAALLFLGLGDDRGAIMMLAVSNYFLYTRGSLSHLRAVT